MLRLQNVPEETHGNLRATLGETLALLAELDQETLQSELDLVYRVNSNFAKKHNAPR